MSEKHVKLFNTIAPYYNLFYKYQVRYYKKILGKMKPHLDLAAYRSILDVGAGTGALSFVLHSFGMKVTGVDTSGKMLSFAKRRLKDTDVTFTHTHPGKPLSFPDKCFDLSISSYTAHGMKEKEREIFYFEMARVTKHKVVYHDYNSKRTRLTDFIERLEGSDYLNFIKNAEKEMKTVFKNVVVIDAGPTASWYICTPR